ncbi:hypothetical protein GOP47_0014589 [Adiantum capillus-veneris]|uniref:Cyclic nucleotide-binding domain-containing protein n=1 Tax=Adiantum capillus-veneris TaxID=13818 RepID=A0A9D4UMI7_ADICA|nr:hypothetical protein GOP47_0014589 [Adiantum capillus-veneris]
MDGQPKRFVRLQENKSGNYSESVFEVESSVPPATKDGLEDGSRGFRRLGTFFQSKPSKVHAESLQLKKKTIFDPREKRWQQWHSVFLFSCLAALFIDPLFFYLPVVKADEVCLLIDRRLAIVITVLRTIVDVFHVIHIGVLFRTGFIAPSSNAHGRGELVSNPVQIAIRYLSRQFILDFIAVLPLPQMFIWVIVPALKGTAADNTKTAMRFIILVQLIPRIYPLTQQLGKSTSKVHTETAWGGAAYNLLLYMLISHFFGAFYYLLAVEREDACWREVCKDPGCDVRYLDCKVRRSEGYQLNTTDLQASCTTSNFDFGIYKGALDNGIISTSKFVDKYVYCLWFGLRNLSTLGQGLETSSYDGELIFSIIIVIIGLTLFARLLGNMQSYLQSITLRLEEMRLKRHDMEQWMQHRQIYPELRSRIRNYEQYKWLETRGVNEEELVQVLSKDLKRDIKRHLCLDLVKKVPLFTNMDEQLLDAMCERLQPTLFTSGTNVVQEGDPVDEMLFIIRGVLKSVTTNGGRTGFLNEGKLEPGDFCGEELLTWALDPKAGGNFPSSTRSVNAESEVEAFALKAEDLIFVASQFRRLHSKQVQHTFRHYSQQWRTWAACSIQAAWRRYKRRKLAELRLKEEEENLRNAMQENSSSLNHLSLGAALFASRFAANAMRGVHRLRALNTVEVSRPSLKLQKPAEPDFSGEDGD